jgi:sugar lactone lactonase YvrE
LGIPVSSAAPTAPGSPSSTVPTPKVGLTGVVVPVDTVTWRAGRPVHVGAYPNSIFVSPDGRTAYAAAAGLVPDGTVTPIDTPPGEQGL